MSHFYNNSKDSGKLKEMIGDNPIADDMGKQAKKDEKYEMFEAIEFLISSARKLYMNEDLSWSDMCGSLCEAIDKLKTKEKSLKALVPKKKEGDMPETC